MSTPLPVRPRSGPSKLVFVVAALAIGIAGGAVWAVLAPSQAVAAEVTREAHSTAGDNPFMTPVGQDQPGVAPPAGAAGSFAGDTPGLYGESGDRPSCDSATLVSNLRADVVRASAWSQALNVRVEDIPAFAQSLNPVLLRADTAVTEHGYAEPRYTSYPAVLQAGTAVFVNGFGEPTVKCFSGNPLTRPADFAQASYRGTRWSTFRPGGYTYVRPTTIVIKSYNYYNVTKKVIVVKGTWCSRNPDAKGCDRPNPSRWCDDHPDWSGCDSAKRDRDGDKDESSDRESSGSSEPDKEESSGSSKPGESKENATEGSTDSAATLEERVRECRASVKDTKVCDRLAEGKVQDETGRFVDPPGEQEESETGGTAPEGASGAAGGGTDGTAPDGTAGGDSGTSPFTAGGTGGTGAAGGTGETGGTGAAPLDPCATQPQPANCAAPSGSGQQGAGPPGGGPPPAGQPPLGSGQPPPAGDEPAGDGRNGDDAGGG
ncbi:MAG: DUF6777 domain-containing protein [Pseudonocardia sp.]